MSHGESPPAAPRVPNDDHPRGRLATLTYPDFRWLLFMQFTATMGQPMVFLTQAWYVAVTAPEGQRVFSLGVLSALRGTAFLGYALFGGTFADRFPRTTVLAISHIVALASVLLVGSLLFVPAVLQGEGPWLWVMLLLFSSFGLIDGQDQPTRTAMIRDTVPASLLGRAVTQHQFVLSLALLSSAPLVGLSIDLLGFGPAYLLASVGHVSVLLAITRMPATPAADPEASSQSVVSNLRDGIGVMRADRVVRWTILSFWIVMALGLSVMVGLIAVWAREVLDLGASGWGIMIVFWGAGGILASVWLNWRADLTRTGAWYLASCALMGLAVLSFGLSRVVIVAFLFNGLVGLSQQLVLILSLTLVQRRVPNRVMGRVTGLLMLAGGMMQLAALIVGGIAQVVGIELVYPAAGVAILILTALVVLRQRPLWASPRGVTSAETAAERP